MTTTHSSLIHRDPEVIGGVALLFWFEIAGDCAARLR